MQSRIAEELKLKYQPVAVILTDTEQAGAATFAEGKWGCAVAMHMAAARGRTAAFDREHCGCQGAAVGLGFGGFRNPNMAEFLSTGSSDRAGEHYWKSPDEARAFMEAVPLADIPFKYVVFKPLSELKEGEIPAVVNLYANPDQISALVVLANYGRKTADNVAARMGAGCHTLCLIPMDEAKKDPPRAVIGLFDITARQYVDADLLSFSMPYSMFVEMENNVSGSFLDHDDWKKVRARIGG